MADEQQQVFQLQRLYLKDASFECPGAPDVFLQEWKPKVNVQLIIFPKLVLGSSFVVI